MIQTALNATLGEQALGEDRQEAPPSVHREGPPHQRASSPYPCDFRNATQPFHSLRCTACVSLFPELRRSEVGRVSGSHSVQPLNPASPAHCFKTLPTNVCGAPLVPGTEGMAGVRRPRPGPQARAFQWGSVGSEQENKSVKMTRQCSKHMKKME